MPVVIGVIVVVVVLYYLASRGRGEQQDVEDVEAELLHLCLGNRQQAERLLELEIKKTPNIDRVEAARRAIRSFKRDLK